METDCCTVNDSQCMNTADIVQREEPALEVHDPSFQDLPGPRVDLAKLSRKLKSKFGSGEYHIQLMHDVLRIKAPGRLSSVCEPSTSDQVVLTSI